MKVGLIGAGNISATHARAAIAAGLEIGGVWSRDFERAVALAQQFGGRACESLEALLGERGIDLVAIGTASGVHADQAMAAARAGKHVLVEKPLDIATARIDELNIVVREAGVKLGVFFQDRLKPDVLVLKNLVDAGALGAPVLGSARVKWHRSPEYYALSRWRGTYALDGGGALMNQAIHTVDLLLWMMGPITRIAARTATRLHKIESEDTAVAVLEFESGALGVIEAGTSIYPGYPRRLELTGTNGTVVLEGDKIASRDLMVEPPSEDAAPSAGMAESKSGAVAASSHVVADASAHQRVFEDFLEAIQTGRRPACDGHEGRKSVAVIEAIYESAKR